MIFEVLFSVLLLALLGGMHCAAMCGGISLAVARGDGTPVSFIARGGHAQWRRIWLRDTLVMHAGRVSTYVMLGALMGAMGALAWKQQILPLQRSLFGIGSAMLVLSGLWLLRGSAPHLPKLERAAARVAQSAIGVVKAGGRGWADRFGQASAPPWLRRYAIGLAWGLVPCGMVYTALALALLAGNARSGALVMAVFGLGTLPNLIVLAGLSGWLRQQARRPWVRAAAGLAMAAFGMAGLARAVFLPEVLARHGFCLAL